ncbi:DUF6053 domain-containing protein [Luteimonas gilva]
MGGASAPTLFAKPHARSVGAEAPPTRSKAVFGRISRRN